MTQSGDDRDRTGYLRVANAALSQMSYVPKVGYRIIRALICRG